MGKREKCLFICFVLLFAGGLSCFSSEKNKEYVLDGFFETVKMMDGKSFPAVETMEAEVSSEIIFSEKTLEMLRPLVAKIFGENLPERFESRGTLKVRFQETGKGKNPSDIYLNTVSPIGSFVFIKKGDRVEVHLPLAGCIVEDSMEEISAISGMLPAAGGRKAFLPADFASSLFSYVTGSEREIRERISMSGHKGEAGGKKTHIFNYPVEKGSLEIEIYDEIWTFASMRFLSEDSRGLMEFRYSPPEDSEITPENYLPDAISFKGEKDGNEMSVNLSSIRYGRLFSDNDFSLRVLNIREFIAYMYMKLLEAPR